MDYFKLLNFKKEPFSNSPDPDLFYHSKQHVQCLQKLEISIRLKRGLNVVIGDVGTGKTTVCRQLLRVFAKDEDIVEFMILDPFVISSYDFLLYIAKTFNIELSGSVNSELGVKEEIKKYLFVQGVDKKKTVVLIIDEGQKISVFCLEVLRELLNYETNEYKLLQIVIFAQAEFYDIITPLHNFMDRINLLYHLKPLGFNQTVRLIKFRLACSYKISGKTLDFFTYPAFWMIYRQTRGYPRKIINLCHKCILSMIIHKHARIRIQNVYRQVEAKKHFLFNGFVPVAAVFFVMLFFLFVAGSKNKIAETFSLLKQNIFYDKIVKTENGVLLYDKLYGNSKCIVLDDEVILAKNIASLSFNPSVFDKKNSNFPILDNGLINIQAPLLLGYLSVKNSETISILIKNVYGVFDKKILNALLQVNPHILDADKIDTGDLIYFPVISGLIKNSCLKTWWIQFEKTDNLSKAVNILRQSSDELPKIRIIPCYKPDDGLWFALVYHSMWFKEEHAVKRLNNIKKYFPEAKLLCIQTNKMKVYSQYY